MLQGFQHKENGPFRQHRALARSVEWPAGFLGPVIFPGQNAQEAEAAQAEVAKYFDLMYSEGYFRDSYNVTNVLWRLGLTWP